jgi:hydrogenase nickel incorporation protein HypB
MCQDCGCGDPRIVPVKVQERILADNDRTAQHNREHFADHGVLALNLMGSPGSGKTTLLEATAQLASKWLRIGAVSGDLATDNDGSRLRLAGIQATTITTGTACHLDARLIHHALHDFDLHELDLFVIENVGNLVCPAIYDLGQAANVVALSVTEGADKPLKYPTMFGAADLVLLTKIDLLPALPEVKIEAIQEALAKVNPRPRLLPLSARSLAGMPAWLAWIAERRLTAGALERAAHPV